jgi:hypothetical protein
METIGSGLGLQAKGAGHMPIKKKAEVEHASQMELFASTGAKSTKKRKKIEGGQVRHYRSKRGHVYELRRVE